jgi:FeS assembly SUF system regulator
MLKLTKKADYGLIALKHLAEAATREGDVVACSTKEIADAYDIPQEALAKILQRLAKAGMLVSHHGINGGYALARSSKTITAFEVIKAIDGQLFLTSCSTHKGECHQSSKCNVKEPLRKVNDSIHAVLTKITIADMQDPEGPATNENESKPVILQSNLVTLG